MVRGVIQYLQCAGLETGDGHECSSDGPGVISSESFVCSNLGTNTCFWISVGEYWAKSFMVYVAFFLLSYSVSLGGKIFVDHRLEGAEIALFERSKHKGEHDKDSKNGPKKKWPGFSLMKRVRKVKATILNYDDKTGMHTIVYHHERKRCKKYGMAKYPTHLKDLERVNFKMLKLPGVPKNVMNFLFWYDLAVLLVVWGLGLMTILIWGREEWMAYGVVYWCKVFCQLFSFPFLMLKIPGLKVLVTHAKKTGYKPNGTLVLHKKRKKNNT